MLPSSGSGTNDLEAFLFHFFSLTRTQNKTGQVLDNGLTVLRHGNLLALIVLVALLHGVVLVAAVAALGRVVGRKSWPVVPLALGHASTQV